MEILGKVIDDYASNKTENIQEDLHTYLIEKIKDLRESTSEDSKLKEEKVLD